jgi:hypothetical protein
MPYILEELVIDRVDLVDEGANSAAFIELFKRKESDMTLEEIISKMKPEYANQISKSLADLKNDAEQALLSVTEEKAKNVALTTELAKVKGEAEEAKSKLAEVDLAKAKVTEDTEEEILKSLPDSARVVVEKLKAQKEAAEEEVRKTKEATIVQEATTKALELKALPIEKSKLVDLIKGANSDLLDMLTAANAAIEGTVLTEEGVSKERKDSDAWDDIEKAAETLAKAESISKQKAIAKVIKEQPELYRKYLEGGNK